MPALLIAFVDLSKVQWTPESSDDVTNNCPKLLGFIGSMDL